jgi:PiT family inorganic phosphate transporter
VTFIVMGAVLFLAWSNGANDNFKGVASLYGSGTTSYGRALAWATLTTAGGTLLTLVLAAALVKTFSARGLVPDAVASSPVFLGAAALAAALAILVATVAGMPVSTTHALTGALVGAALASGGAVRFAVLGRSFVLPLLLSPFLSAAIAAVLLPLARLTSRGGVASASLARGMDGLHFLSAGAVCFARALNDAPKIVGILIGAKAVGAHVGLGAVGLAMAIGGLTGARRVAETMSKRIVPLDPGQGLVVNLTTASLVIAASTFGLPVSTTQVAGGGLFGIGAATGGARWRTITTILLAWVATLPVGALLGAAAMSAFGWLARVLPQLRE